MRQPLFVTALAATAIALAAAANLPEPSADIKAAVAASTRTPANLARDQYRHPAETLSFFGVKPTDTVVEIWPGGGWYTEILAPLTKGKGTYYAASPWPDGNKGVQNKQTADAATYGHVKFAAFPWAEGQPKVPDGTADVVLTFRNVHNWRMGYQRGGTDYSGEAFAQMFAMLKPGGTLGIVDHRLPESASDDREKSSGYIKVSTIRRLAEAAGFEFVGASEINANAKDTADWPKGVWTLPPSLSQKDVDREKYVAIGESDRMTLRFRKPR
ncbi:class I SAM-dependent methyltransferase [Sphingomonas sp. G-3-2-10]|uniref:class I SAM-dependent methyltransferase n=1 Tax=Sphingomonas sp. G-3-2-10 TaxID=2728838 RepID=UPI00146CA55D|nr:class I SAM-dependent methyltransferase [Sphingomonas sp. G-3-2-10]NML07499.1 class I SAM-dependent methyltransferase [Sphingomonas sp. G-3-2-10]